MTDTKKWEKELEKIMDKNTTNLTKTGDIDFNPPEIISFDKVVFEKYKATLDIKKLTQDLLLQTQIETLKWCEREVVGGISKYHIDGEHTETANALIEVFQEEQRQIIKHKIEEIKK